MSNKSYFHSPKSEGNQLNSSQRDQRDGLKVLGFALVIAGAIFAIIGLADFFDKFSNPGGPPEKFWCLFVGMPMLGLGITCLKYAFLGTVSRYVAGETMPVAKDSANYLIDGTRDSVVSVVREATGNPGIQNTGVKSCPKCGTENDSDAKFCKSCGSGFPAVKICSCGEENAADAKFCNECGSSLS